MISYQKTVSYDIAVAGGGVAGVAAAITAAAERLTFR